MVKDKVYVVLVNYNEYESTIECVKSLLESSYNYYDILIVDNCSPNDSYAKLYEYFSNQDDVNFMNGTEYKGNTEDNSIVLFKSVTNNGFAAGCNIATKIVLSNKSEGYMWYLNNDTIVDKNAMETLTENMENDKNKICSSTLVKYGTKNVQCFGGGYINGLLGYQKYFGENEKLYNVIKNSAKLKKEINEKLDYIVGASMLVPIDLLKKYGLMQEGFFLYWEETDFCYMMKSNRVKLEWIPNSIVYHKIGQSTDITSELTDYYSTRNTIKFFKKWYPQNILVVVLVNLTLKIINRISRGQFNRIKLVINAIKKGYNNK